MSKIFQNDKREVIAVLPVSGQEVKLKPPTGKDMKKLEAANQGETTNFGAVMKAVSLLSGLDIEQVEEMDAEDVEVLGEALTLFPVFNKLDK